MPESPPWIDWRSIATKTVTRIIMVTPGAVVVLAIWLLGISEQGSNTAAVLENHLKEVAENQTAEQERRATGRLLVEQLLEMYKEDMIRERTIIGVGRAGTFGSDESYIRINRRSDANIYKDGDPVQITVIEAGQGEMRSTLRVQGTFADANRDVMLIFSARACNELGIIGPVEVLMEPLPQD